MAQEQVNFLFFEIFLFVFFFLFLFLYYQCITTEKKKSRILNHSLVLKEKKEVTKKKRKNFFAKILQKISCLLAKIPFFKTYVKKYKKYAIFQYQKDPMDFLSFKLFVAICVMVLFLCLGALLQNAWFIGGAFLVFLLSFFLLDFVLDIQQRLRTRKIKKDLLNAILVMNHAFQVGCSTIQAIDAVSIEMTGPIREEFQKIKKDFSCGLSLEEVFMQFQERVPLKEMQSIVISLSILEQTGGNVGEMFSTIEQSLRNKKQQEEEFKSLTASAKMMFQILILIPPFLTLLLLFLNLSYFAPLFKHAVGICILVLLLLLYVGYIFMIWKVMRRKEEF